MNTMSEAGSHRVVIIGGGFAGLRAARSLAETPVQVTLLDRRNYHLFQPLLYQVASGALSPANIAAPIRALLKNQANASVLLAEVVDFDLAGRRVLLKEGSLPYDTLIVATGAGNNYFGHPEWEAHAPSLKSLDDATDIRRRILIAFEAAEREPDAKARRTWLTFVVVGAGPTGVELAGQLAELSQTTLRRDFRNFRPQDAHIVLVEAGTRVLTSFTEGLSARALSALRRLGVDVWLSAQVTDIQVDRVSVRRNDQDVVLATRTTLWAAGVEGSPLGRRLAAACGAEVDRWGRIIVEPDLTISGHPEIFAIGDIAHVRSDGQQPLPGVAPVAMQQGTYVARLVAQRLRRDTLPAFRYHNRGNLATIGKHAAVADLGWVRFSGYFAWLAWLFIHIMYLVQFQNRLLVLLQWAWSYFTLNRSARLITGEKLMPPLPAPHSGDGSENP